MKRTNLCFLPAAAFVLAVAAATFSRMSPVCSAKLPAAALPTAGLREYTDEYKVQCPYNLKPADRFSSAGGEFSCWIDKGDKPFKQGSSTGPRTEMRWKSDWSKTEHLWEADVLVEPGSDGVCIMQVKTNSGFEPVYLNVKKNNLYHDSKEEVVFKDCTGKWFHVLAGYNPATGVARVWINGELKLSREERHPPDTQWYFKNGVYNTKSDTSKAHFKNIKFWRIPGP